MSNKALLGKRAEDLSNLIEQQTQPIFDSLGIIVPIKSCSTLLCLQEVAHSSLADIARKLEQSHQLVKQKLPKLIKLGLIKQQPDKEDKRRTLYSLTTKGISQTSKIQTYLAQSEQLVESISKDVGIDVFEAIDKAIKTMQEKTLWERYKGAP
ncbi:MarR family winged helix-turn-helix transcriptional regulator [Kangiella koreensis]|uniref:Putative transcriptional regulator n=1 Tax=Kangiella koreensis (strain DSM 16069 / JCM 12317 / KCTC 12182 / SW-125) TaxID=523791 RepID=C7RAY9_KANKD|nr:MarR family winged helix-turn-helix transcriptional regulator [Kangiella koreensis]ACV26431.1 putative transcriptional regulator [Kangiella koreensis DSM 16069]